MTDILGIYNYWIYVLLMMIGLYGVIAKPNLIKQAIALGLLLYLLNLVVSLAGAPSFAIGHKSKVAAA